MKLTLRDKMDWILLIVKWTVIVTAYVVALNEAGTFKLADNG